MGVFSKSSSPINQHKTCIKDPAMKSSLCLIIKQSLAAETFQYQEAARFSNIIGVYLYFQIANSSGKFLKFQPYFC